MTPLRLDILFQDRHLVAVNKPAGLLVHPSQIDRRERWSAMQALRDQLGHRVYPLHRLDKPTSGVLLFALSREAARAMGEVFQSREVDKTYLAIVRGYTASQGVIDHPLRERPDRMTDTRAVPDKPAQPALTRYRRLATVELPYPVDPHATSRYSLLLLAPETGRKHQIRRHLKHLAHPVIGDTTHGKSLHNRLFQDRLHSRRLLLAAVQMRFTHPFQDGDCCINAPLQADFAGVIQRLGWRDNVPDAWLHPAGTDPRLDPDP